MATSVTDMAPTDQSNSSEIQIPSTPPPVLSTSTRSATESQSQQFDKSTFVSPPPQSSSMTPPPSTQPVRFHSPIPRLHAIQSDPLLASPPATVKTQVSGNLPTPEVIANAGLEDLRSIAQDLVQAVSEARMSTAHWKLQHNLLTIETQESAQRAEVEHQMTRREVEVLQAAEQRHRATLSNASQTSQSPSQTQLDILTKRCKDLEDQQHEVERRLRKAKKLLVFEKDKSELVVEENVRLKMRIRENREHFTRFKNVSPLYATQRDAFTTPQRKSVPRFSESAPSHTFAAILAADQLLSGESVSVPSTPTKSQPSKFKHGHTRGAHSLSSLHNTPARSRQPALDPFTDTQLTYSAPSSQLVNESAERERHDRDSTISVSDDEGAVSDGNIPQSQASSLATSMLRKNPGSQESLRLSQSAEQSSNLLQSKLFGNIKKAGVDRSARKRQANNGDGESPTKKSKLVEGVGLGIGAWSPKT